MDEEIKATLHLIVDMIDTLGKKIDRLETRMDSLETRMDSLETRMDRLETRMDSLETRMDRMENDIKDIKLEQNKTNERLDTIASMYGSHEEAIRRLKSMKIL